MTYIKWGIGLLVVLALIAIAILPFLLTYGIVELPSDNEKSSLDLVTSLVKLIGAVFSLLICISGWISNHEKKKELVLKESRIETLEISAREKEDKYRSLSDEKEKLEKELSKTLRSTAPFRAKMEQIQYTPVEIPDEKERLPGDKKNSVVMVGIGGVGKTKLISKMFGINIPQTNRKTEHASVYKNRFIVDPSSDRGVWNYILDYRGQSLADLVRTFIKQQYKPNSYFKFGNIQTLMFVVDLRKPPPIDEHGVRREDTVEPKPKEDKKRVVENLENWNAQSISAAFGMVEIENLKSVLFLINKWDLVSSHTKTAEDRILQHYKPMVEEIEKHLRSSECNFSVEVLFCSAKDNRTIGISNIQDFLKNNSVPIEGGQ